MGLGSPFHSDPLDALGPSFSRGGVREEGPHPVGRRGRLRFTWLEDFLPLGLVRGSWSVPENENQAEAKGRPAFHKAFLNFSFSQTRKRAGSPLSEE